MEDGASKTFTFPKFSSFKSSTQPAAALPSTVAALPAATTSYSVNNRISDEGTGASTRLGDVKRSSDTRERRRSRSRSRHKHRKESRHSSKHNKRKRRSSSTSSFESSASTSDVSSSGSRRHRSRHRRRGDRHTSRKDHHRTREKADKHRERSESISLDTPGKLDSEVPPWLMLDPYPDRRVFESERGWLSAPSYEITATDTSKYREFAKNKRLAHTRFKIPAATSAGGSIFGAIGSFTRDMESAAEKANTRNRYFATGKLPQPVKIQRKAAKHAEDSTDEGNKGVGAEEELSLVEILQRGFAQQGRTDAIIDATTLFRSQNTHNRGENAGDSSQGGRSSGPSTHVHQFSDATALHSSASDERSKFGVSTLIPLDPITTSYDAAAPSHSAVGHGDDQRRAAEAEDKLYPEMEPLTPAKAPWESPQEFRSRRLRQLHKVVRMRPNDDQAWLQLAIFVVGVAVNSGRSRDSAARWEEALAVCESGLSHLGFNTKLLCMKMSCLGHMTADYTSLLTEWRSALMDDRAVVVPDLALGFLQEVTARFDVFSISTFRKCAIWLLQRLRDAFRVEQAHELARGQVMLAGSHQRLTIENTMLDVLDYVVSILQAAGHIDQAFAIAQAIFEYNVCMPEELSKSDQQVVTAWFSIFWSSGEPKVGDILPVDEFCPPNTGFKGWLADAVAGYDADDLTKAGVGVSRQRTRFSTNRAGADAVPVQDAAPGTHSISSIARLVSSVCVGLQSKIAAQSRNRDDREKDRLGFMANSELVVGASTGTLDHPALFDNSDGISETPDESAWVYSSLHGYRIKVPASQLDDELNPLSRDTALYASLQSTLASAGIAEGRKRKRRNLAPDTSRLADDSDGSKLLRLEDEAIEFSTTRTLDSGVVSTVFSANCVDFRTVAPYLLRVSRSSFKRLALLLLRALGCIQREGTAPQLKAFSHLAWFSSAKDEPFTMHPQLKYSGLLMRRLFAALLYCIREFPAMDTLLLAAMHAAVTLLPLTARQATLRAIVAMVDSHTCFPADVKVAVAGYFAAQCSEIAGVAALHASVTASGLATEPSAARFSWTCILAAMDTAADGEQVSAMLVQACSSIVQKGDKEPATPLLQTLQRHTAMICSALAKELSTSVDVWLQTSASSSDVKQFVWLAPRAGGVTAISHAELRWRVTELISCFLCLATLHAFGVANDPTSTADPAFLIAKTLHKAQTVLLNLAATLRRAERQRAGAHNITSDNTLDIPVFDGSIYTTYSSRLASLVRPSTRTVLVSTTHAVDEGGYVASVLGLPLPDENEDGPFVVVGKSASWEDVARSLMLHVREDEHAGTSAILQQILDGSRELFEQQLALFIAIRRRVSVKPCFFRYAYETGLTLYPHSEKLIVLAAQALRLDEGQNSIHRLQLFASSLQDLHLLTSDHVELLEMIAVHKIEAAVRSSALADQLIGSSTGPSSVTSGDGTSQLSAAVESIERLLATEGGRKRDLYWRWLIRLHLLSGNPSAAYRTYFRAVTACPWSKSLWLDACTRLQAYMDPEELSSLIKTAVERTGIHFAFMS